MNTQNIQDIYELSPIQQGILFHCVYAPESGFYIVQKTFTLSKNFNLINFDRAWQQVVARHTSLRTSFYWEETNKPLQVVYKYVKVPIEQQDWRGLAPVEQQTRLESFLKSDRQKSIDLFQKCLMRLTLLRLSDDSYKFIWTSHFINMDGWSEMLVLNDFIQLYEAFCQDKEPSLRVGSSYKNYITWLQQQDLSQAKVFWQQTLKGLKAPTLLTKWYVDSFSNQEEKHDIQRIFLSETKTAELISFARQHQITLNTLIQGAWAWLLSRYSGTKKVVYGYTTFCRPVDLVEVDSMVGTFVNALPMWVEVDDRQALLPWLKQLQGQLVEMRRYEYVPLVEIQECTKIPQNIPLFESLVTFEKVPLMSSSIFGGQTELEVVIDDIWYKTNYPLNLVVYPVDQLILEIAHHCHIFDATTAAGMLQHLAILLQDMLNNPEARLEDLTLLTPAHKQLRQILAKEAILNSDFSSCS
ncbi:MAG: condensation domain-containing protein [Cyanobacteria bacterium P01_A01_bin.40]